MSTQTIAIPTAEELDYWRGLCRQATPGPWSWNEGKWNAKYPSKKDVRRRLVYCLQGPAHLPPITESLDSQYDHPTVMVLHWSSVKGDTLANASPSPPNRKFIVEARTALPRLLDYVSELEQEIARLRG
jgi:hypothetical protein